MSGPSTYQPKTGFERWLDARLPIIRFSQEHLLSYPTPRNLNVWYTFGGILSVFLVAQILTGIVLAMHYTADSRLAFDSVEHIMRDVNCGMAVALSAFQRRVDVLPRPSISICSAGSITAPTRRRAR